MKYTQIPSTAFKELQMNAGILVKTFTPGTGVIGDLIGATTGGMTFAATPTYTDYGDDIDNCPKNMKELKKLDSWEATLSGTFLTITPDSVKGLLGAADASNTFALTTDSAIVDGKTYYTKNGDAYEVVESPQLSDIGTYYELNFSKVTPRADLAQADFSDIWWVGDYSDINVDGTSAGKAGYCAVHLMNALNNGGFQIKTTDKAKGQFAFSYTAHYSMDAQTTVPFEIYIKSGTAS